MTPADPELARLLAQELERHLPALVGRDLQSAQRAAHAVKGSAGLAGERDLAAALTRLEKRLRDGDRLAMPELAELVRGAIERLASGRGATVTEWPEPPADLGPSQVDPGLRPQYAAELVDRLAQVDEALARVDDPTGAVLEVYRHVHTIKGAASAVGDEPMSWFCHGLEEWLHAGTGSVEGARAALAEVGRWRAVLGGLLDDPGRALVALRAAKARAPGSAHPAPAAGARRGGSEEPPRSAAPPVADEATIRVQARSIDRVLEGVTRAGLVEELMTRRRERARVDAAEVRRLRADLEGALRLIGPPRPWGAPAAALRAIERAAGALAVLGESLDSTALELRAGDQVLKDSMRDAKLQLAAMRQTPLRATFARMATAVESEAHRAGRIVVVRTEGAEEPVDRRVAEVLGEACMTLARNAVAHGIETPEERERLGKGPVGTISLSARKSAGRLVLTIADDGAGVDMEAVRRRAVDAGAVDEAVARTADDNTLLALLFVPGFSMRESADVLAGRGLGLDIARAAIQRLGGVIRLSSRRGLGFEARLEVPVEQGIAHVLWVTAAGTEHAVAAASALAVRQNDGPDADRIPHLAACLEPLPSTRAPFALDLLLDEQAEEDARISVGIDAVGRTEEVLVRPLTPLVAGVGPFAGAIVRGDGTLRMALDVQALAPRVRALGKVPEGHAVAFPAR